MHPNSDIVQRASAWLSPSFDEKTQQEVRKLLQEPAALNECFYKNLEFGTGGIRGLMGVGTNRVNAYTFGLATQALVKYLQGVYPATPIRVGICCDTRHQSLFLMQKVADVLSANGILVYTSTAPLPTPLLSFWVRHKKLQAGLVITASHNPKEYNGYKVYWSDGAQLTPPHDQNILQIMQQLSFEEIQWHAQPALLQNFNPQDEQDYLDYACSLQEIPQTAHKNITIAYSALHGAGAHILPQLLRQAGYLHLHEVESQKVMDGDFPSVPSPNPEDPKALQQVIELAKNVNAHLAFATDPDADRIGLCIPNHQNEWIALDGHQIGILLTYYILTQKKAKGTLLANSYICKSIVTTHYLNKIADFFGVKVYDTLTGFKWIAHKMAALEGKEHFVLGIEESFGYLLGDKIRDKDGVSTALLLCEIAAYCQQNQTTIYDLLQTIESTFGLHLEKTISLQYEGREGMQKMQACMQNLREKPASTIAGIAVVKIADFSRQKLTFADGSEQALDFPIANVLQYTLAEGSVLTIRPSGTEPKLKIYVQCCGDSYPAMHQKIDHFLQFKPFYE